MEAGRLLVLRLRLLQRVRLRGGACTWRRVTGGGGTSRGGRFVGTGGESGMPHRLSLLLEEGELLCDTKYHAAFTFRVYSGIPVRSQNLLLLICCC